MLIMENITYRDTRNNGNRLRGSRRIDNDLDIAKELVRSNHKFKT